MSWNAKWRPEWDRLLGTMPDEVLSQRLGVRRCTVSDHRRQLKVPRFNRRQKIQCSSCPRMVRRRARRKVVTCRQCELRKVRERSRDWYQSHKGKFDPGKWWKSHRAERLAYSARWREKNRERIRRYARIYARKQYRRNKALLRSLPCIECGMRHTIERRLTIIRRMLPCHTAEIHEAWECIWGRAGIEHKGSAGAQRLLRDLRRLGAVYSTRGEYSIPERMAA